MKNKILYLIIGFIMGASLLLATGGASTQKNTMIVSAGEGKAYAVSSTGTIYFLSGTVSTPVRVGAGAGPNLNLQ